MVTTKYITINDLLDQRQGSTILDVRTPAEFEKGHILGAINLPIFTNEDRIKVGTLYKQKDRKKAILKGFELVGPKAKEILLQADKCSNKNIILHCWRGNLRSYTMSWMLNLYGIPNKVLEGGYKSYRRKLKSSLSEPSNIWILSGMTGSGKTEILLHMQKSGEQVLDLEGLAHHRGSAFGKIGQDKQLPNEQFENNLGDEWLKFDYHQPIWIEDEGRNIGSNFIPDELFLQMRNNPVIKINVPAKDRIKRLVHDYANCEKEVLIENVNKISKRLGGQNAKGAVEAIKNNNLEKAVEIILIYYDKAYEFSLSKREPSILYKLELNSDQPKSNAEKILTFQKQLSNERN